jgi:hypothetical protein
VARSLTSQLRKHHRARCEQLDIPFQTAEERNPIRARFRAQKQAQSANCRPLETASRADASSTRKGLYIGLQTTHQPPCCTVLAGLATGGQADVRLVPVQTFPTTREMVSRGDETLK